MQTTRRSVDVMYLQYVYSGKCRNIAVLLLDRATDALLMRFTKDLGWVEESELEIVSALAEDITTKAHELGASALVDYFSATLSNTLRITDPQHVFTEDVDAELEKLSLKNLLAHNGTVVAVADTWNAVRPLSWKAWPAIALSFNFAMGATKGATKRLSDWANSLRRAHIVWSVGAGASVLLVLFGGTRALNSLKPDAEVLDLPVTLVSMKIEARRVVPPADISISAPGPKIPAVASRKRVRRPLRRIHPSRTFIPPENQPETSSVAMFDPLGLVVEPNLSVSSMSSDGILDVPVLPPPPKGEASGLRRFGRLVSYPFRKVGSVLAEL